MHAGNRLSIRCKQGRIIKFGLTPWSSAARILLKMIEFQIDDGNIELVRYPEDITLSEFAEELDTFRLQHTPEIRDCYACGECCGDPVPVLGYDILKIRAEKGVETEESLRRFIDFPRKPDLEARRKGINELRSHNGLDELEAALIYEYNQAEPFTMARKEGACYLLEENLCTVHDGRFYICRLFFCNLGDKLSGLFDSIVSQGVWFSYSLMGWLPEEEIPHNPFLKANSYDRVRLSDFDVDLRSAVENLFFYF